MPSSRSLSRMRFPWLLRAAALRRCAQAIFLAAFASTCSLDRRDDNPHERTNAAIAVCSWQTVSSVAFFPPFLPHPRQEQVADTTDDQVTFQPQVTPPLVLVQSDLGFLVLEATFHSPARKSDQEQGPHTRAGRCVAHKELQLRGVQHVARDQQVERLPRVDRQPP